MYTPRMRTCFLEPKQSERGAALNFHSIVFILLVFRVISVSNDEINLYLSKIHDNPSFKGAFGRSLTRIVYLNKKLPTASTSHKICKDVVVTTPCVIYSVKDFYLLDEMNKQIGMLKASGLIRFWNSKYSEMGPTNIRKPKTEKVLTIRDLSGCIQIWVFGCSASLAVFVLELLTRVVRRCL